MSLPLHEIAEVNHRVLDPFSDAQLMEVGEVARVKQGTRVLDLACGTGDMLCRWAQDFGSRGVGVDISEVFVTAARILDRFKAARTELVEMVLADEYSWDRNVAAQWWTLRQWLDSHPGDPLTPDVHTFLDHSQREYLTYQRHYLGWGVFVLKPSHCPMGHRAAATAAQSRS